MKLLLNKYLLVICLNYYKYNVKLKMMNSTNKRFEIKKMKQFQYYAINGTVKLFWLITLI